MSNSTSSLVILLHGVGSSGDDLKPLAEAWDGALKNTKFVSPNAPNRSSFGNGFQWFSVAGVTEENRGGRIQEARAAFDNTISSIVGENGFAEKLDRVAFVGFSQGTIMALDAVASGRWPIGAVVGFSGRLASPQPLMPSTNTKILLIHGTVDPTIPSSETIKAASVLQSLGVSVESVLEPGLSHTISADGATKAGQFLAAKLLG